MWGFIMKVVKIDKGTAIIGGTEIPVREIEFSFTNKRPPPDVGTRVLALYKGDWIVLEVGEEVPTYEENFTRFKYWFEPFSDMLDIEIDDVYDWIDLPDKEDYL